MRALADRYGTDGVLVAVADPAGGRIHQTLKWYDGPGGETVPLDIRSGTPPAAGAEAGRETGAIDDTPFPDTVGGALETGGAAPDDDDYRAAVDLARRSVSDIWAAAAFAPEGGEAVMVADIPISRSRRLGRRPESSGAAGDAPPRASACRLGRPGARRTALRRRDRGPARGTAERGAGSDGARRRLDRRAAVTSGQFVFGFEHRPALGEESFLVAPGNRDAGAWIDRWPDWPGRVLAIHGPQGCGKSHPRPCLAAKERRRRPARRRPVGTTPRGLAGRRFGRGRRGRRPGRRRTRVVPPRQPRARGPGRSPAHLAPGAGPAGPWRCPICARASRRRRRRPSTGRTTGSSPPCWRNISTTGSSPWPTPSWAISWPAWSGPSPR